jgi:phosphoribosylamine-glycine ligase
MPLIDEPLIPMLTAAADRSLTQSVCRIATRSAVGVVIASRGYPDSSDTGQTIHGIADAEQLPGVAIYHAGTAIKDGHLVTAGGRVLTVVSCDATFPGAIARAYAGVEKIRFDGMQFRRDIGRKAVDERTQSSA